MQTLNHIFKAGSLHNVINGKCGLFAHGFVLLNIALSREEEKNENQSELEEIK